jgi:hypothetical protein
MSLQFTTPKVSSSTSTNFKQQSNTSNKIKKITNANKNANTKTKKIYGTYWQPLYLLILNIFHFWEIPFIDDFIKLIDYDGVEYGGDCVLAVASLEIDIFTHYVRYSKNGKYIYIHTQYCIFRNFVINVKDINITFIKPIDYPTFESAHTLTQFAPLHNKQITITQQQLDIIKEQSLIIRNSLTILDDLFTSLSD